MKYIYYIRKTFQGAYAINGIIGERQYFGYSKRVAIILYNQQCKKEKNNERKTKTRSY